MAKRMQNNPWAAATKYPGGGEVDEEDSAPEEEGISKKELEKEHFLELLNLAQEGGVPAGTAAGAAMGAFQPARDLASDTTEGVPLATDAPPVPGNSQESQLDLRGQLQKYLDAQHGKNDSMQQLADLYKSQMAKENNRPNMTNLNALADHYWGTNFSKANPAPLKESEQTANVAKLQDMANKGNQSTLSDLLRQYGIDSNSVSKEQANYWKNRTSNERTLANSVNTGMTDDMGVPIVLNPKQGQTAQKMHDAMFLGRGSNAQVQQSIGKLRSGVQFENLIAAIPKGQPTPQDMADLTSALGQTVNGTNILTDHRFSSLYPGSMPLTAANVVQWVTGNPKGTDQKEWINRMLNEVRAEKAGAQKTVNRWVDSQEEYFKSAGLPPEFVKRAAKSAKGFYNEAYEPVAGVGGFTGQPGQKAPAANLPADLSPMKEGYRLKQKADGSQYWIHPTTGTTLPVGK